MTARPAAELRRAGQDYQTIAKALNQEGWRPAKRRDTFNASMVRHLLHKTGLDMPRCQRTPVALERRPNEWTIAELARHLPVPEPTLYSWVQKGRLPSRTVRVGGRQLTLLLADEEAVATLRAVREHPHRGAAFRRRSPPRPNRRSLVYPESLKVAMPGRYQCPSACLELHQGLGGLVGAAGGKAPQITTRRCAPTYFNGSSSAARSILPE